ncbi:MAG: DUF2628 domain-containing protein [Clostridia bacterium]|nr:DUF2628 domain-containing protein [Clostridia bacterium]
MRYENEKCVVCGELFKEGDKIVVCPDCGTPHHRECYENNGECACEKLHNDGYVWKKSDDEILNQTNENPISNDNNEKKICPFCGTENDKRAFVCVQCRAPLLEIEKQYQSQHIMIDGECVSTQEFIDSDNTVNVGQASVYIKSNKERFIKSFLKAKFTKGRQKFNWAAFFFNPYWFFYRKMYAPGALFAGLNIAAMLFFMSLVNRCFPEAINYLASVMQQEKIDYNIILEQYKEYFLLGATNNPQLYSIVNVFPIIFLIINIVAGFVANKLYLNKIKKDVLRIRSIARNKDSLTTYLYAKGGTSVFSVLFAVLAIDMLTQLFTML